MKVKLTKLLSILFFSSSSTLLVLVPNLISAQSCTPTSKPYTLKNAIGISQSIYQGIPIINKTSTTSGWNAGASTDLTLTEGNYITYGVNPGKEVILGLSVKDMDANFTTINYAFYNNPSNKIYVLENGVNKTPTSTVTYAANGVLKIAIEGGKVKFYLNGNFIYQSLYVMTNPKLVVDFSLINSSQINNLEIWKCGASTDTDGDGVLDQEDQCPGHDDTKDDNQNGIPDDCEGTCNPVSTTYSILNPTNINIVTNQEITTISKTTTAGWNAGGSSTITLSEGNYITYKLAAGNATAVGLSVSDTNLNSTSINNSFYVDANNNIYVNENATQKASGLGTYYANHILKILIEGGKVKYFCNGKLLYIATTTLTNPQLIVDFSMYGATSQIIDLKIYKCCIPNTITLNSATGTNNQSTCINTALTNISYSITGAANATFTGLPTGVSGSFASNTVTISGTPTIAGTYPYTVNLTGGCGTINSTGTIIVTPNNTIALTSTTGTDDQTKCINTPITNITYTTTGATGATFSGLPAGISGSFSSNVFTISGTPTVAGTFPYTINLTGGCGTVSTSGTITVNPSIEATFEQVGIIGNGTITYQLPATSSNGITGTWNPAILLEGEYEYTFTPSAGQCSISITMPFMVLMPKMIVAYDDDFSDTPINEDIGGQTTTVFENDTINFAEAITSTNTVITMISISPPLDSNTTNPIVINPDGTITVPSDIPVGTYSIEYKITSTSCPLNYDSATATIVVRNPSMARKAKPVQKLSDNILVYPNPSTAIFNIDLTTVKEEYNTINVFNVLGQIIYQGNLISKSLNPINLSNAPSGYYIARVSNSNKSVSFQLIKQ